jgi:coenzyme F420 hydrogenase subunit beta
MSSDIHQLFSTVVKSGNCIGCGACAYMAPELIIVQLDSIGRLQATQKNAADSDPRPTSKIDVTSVCPFADGSNQEDEIGRELYAGGATHDPYIGYHRSTFAGYVIEPPFREKGGSGGFGKWIQVELLRQGLIDAVIHVRGGEKEDGPLHEYAVVSDPEMVISSSKSVYYPIEMSQMLAHVKNTPGRYAIVGVPCFIKAVRLLQKVDPVVKERIRFCIGLVCGHLKTTRYADSLAWQVGIEPGLLRAVDFRRKLPGRPANAKGIALCGPVGNDKTEIVVETSSLLGGSYNDGFFRYQACEFCDDVVGETADISVGDAWLPEYMADGRGTSVIVVRSQTLQSVMEVAASESRIHLAEESPERIAKSQAGGLRDRREGLAYRLLLAKRNHQWHPPKRIAPSKLGLNATRQKIYRLRSRLGQLSHVYFQTAIECRDLNGFIGPMNDLVHKYRELNQKQHSRWKQCVTYRCRVVVGKLLRWLGLGGLTTQHRELVSSRSDTLATSAPGRKQDA